MEPLAFTLAVDLTRAHVRSARPDAPIVPDRAPRHREVRVSTRRAAAGALRRLADRLEPCHPVPA
jgi:hypothetical protein